jgi:hypothetical protein
MKFTFTHARIAGAAPPELHGDQVCVRATMARVDAASLAAQIVGWLAKRTTEEELTIDMMGWSPDTKETP